MEAEERSERQPRGRPTPQALVQAPFARQPVTGKLGNPPTVAQSPYLKGSIALTANLGIASWGKVFDDPMVAAAMLDQLPHRSVVLNITGESYRMRAHRARAANLLLHHQMTNR
jgi:IstB-like ATP binding protein